MQTKTNYKVVSGNYRNYQPDLKWLMRDVAEAHDAAKPFKTVLATGVKFEPADTIENGHGCTMVALCENAKGSNEPQEFDKSTARELIFCTWAFIDKETEAEVKNIETLYLDENGKIWSGVAIPELVTTEV